MHESRVRLASFQTDPLPYLRAICKIRDLKLRLPAFLWGCSDRLLLSYLASCSLVDDAITMDSTATKPTRIGAYDIIDVIGRGGMGTVFRGNDPRIGRAVAIKVLTAAADDPDLLIRFYREAKYTGNLHHQNIVTVYELGHQDGVPYLVMEYLEGVSLEAIIASGRPMPIAEKLGIILQICSGLTYAHQHDLVHRDIKPANIVILGDGTAKIVDFGIALLGGSRLTRTGHVVGSLNYMSPEQLSGNLEVDVRTDVYSTGVVLFQMLTGILPFDGGSTAATLKKIMQDPPPPLINYMKDCPDELEGILQKALAKNREERYPTPEDFSLDLARVHQQYERKMLADTLQQAADSLHRRDFTSARQLVVQVLRAAPQNTEASDLLRQVKQAQEQQLREQQVLQLQMRAEEAFRKNQLEEALQFIEHGMQLDPAGTVFPTLRDAIHEAQSKMAKYRELLKQAEESLRSGDLEAAKRSVMDAQEILPDDAAARTLAGQIIARLEQQLREQKAAERQRQFALAVNAVEKAMSDARMLLFLGQVPEALQALDNVKTEVSQLPPRWVEQFDALKKEALDKVAEQSRPAPQPWGETLGAQTAEIPLPTQLNATVMMQPRGDSPQSAPSGTDAFESHDLEVLPNAGPNTAPHIPTNLAPRVAPSEPVFSSAPPAPPESITGRIATSEMPHDVLFPRSKQPGDSQEREIAPELREFLQPEKPAFPRSMIWLGVAVLVLIGVFVWLILRPKTESTQTHPKPPAPAVSYAEINAEPWATVTGLTPANGDAQSVIGQATPLRVKLPPGQYSVTLQGPNHEQKQVDLTVPQQGGGTCFAVFNKPDLNRLVGKN
jgi:serine/threonine protein kinase